jgi:hypothetical protein
MSSDNEKFIKQQIEKVKNYNTPYYSSTDNIKGVVTEIEGFPYKQHYRGEYNNTDPVIFEREAGFRERFDEKYSYSPRIIVKSKPNYEWQQACSSVTMRHTNNVNHSL